jgi:PAS domain S-box-containing protein
MALYKFRADERIKDKEALVRSQVNLNPEAVFILDKDTTILYINDAFTLQKSPSESSPPARTLASLASSGMISPALLTAVQAHFYDKTPYKFEEEFGAKWLSHTISPLLDQNNQISRCAIQSYDITDIKKRELDLTSLTKQLENEKQSLLLFSAMLDSMDDFVIATDTIGMIIYVNKIFQQRFGYTPEEIREKNISFIKDAGDPYSLEANRLFTDKKTVWSGSVTVVTKFGIRINTRLKSTTVELDRYNIYRVFVLREQLI